MNDFEFLDPRSTPFVEPSWRGELPHLYKDGCSYFVTFRLWDAVVPKKDRGEAAGGTPALQTLRGAGGTPAIQTLRGAGVLPAIQTLRGAGVPPAASPRNAEEVAALSDPPLRLGSCSLAKPEIAALVQHALRHFDKQRYLLAAWCIMPNHVHGVFTPLPGHSPSKILHSWKSFTAHQANKILGRRETFWERESFDHLIRSMEDFDRFVRYVEDNPVTAGLCKAAEDWPWSSARLRASRG